MFQTDKKTETSVYTDFHFGDALLDFLKGFNPWFLSEDGKVPFWLFLSKENKKRFLTMF